SHDVEAPGVGRESESVSLVLRLGVQDEWDVFGGTAESSVDLAERPSHRLKVRRVTRVTDIHVIRHQGGAASLCSETSDQDEADTMSLERSDRLERIECRLGHRRRTTRAWLRRSSTSASSVACSTRRAGDTLS